MGHHALHAARALSRRARGGAVSGSLPRTLGFLYASGAAVALLWTALPHTPDRGDGVVVVMAMLALVLGGVLVRCGTWLAEWLLHLALGGIQLVIGIAYVAGGAPTGDVRLFFLWATPYAALHCSVRAALAHLLWTSTVFITCLAVMPDATHRAAWAIGLMLLGTLFATAVLAASAATALRRAESGQRHEATHDALTGLANRRRLLDVLRDDRLYRAGRGRRALVLLDLDGFKAVNDRYGHAHGDALLQALAQQLLALVGPDDAVCRLGGDEFALVLHDVDGPEHALELASALTLAAAEVRLPDRPQVRVRTSAGVRLLAEPRLDPSTVLRDADAALYVSKREGQARPHLWTVGLRHDGAEQQELADDLRQGLLTGQLHLVYQPVVDISTLRVHGIEVLARWRHPERGDVPPDQFVPCAERAGLIGDLTRWVLRSACQEAAGWPVGPDGMVLNLAVNIGAGQLRDLQIVEDVRLAMAGAGLSAGGLVLEVTETAAVVDLECARRTLEQLAALGVGLALDDFGTGYSSLSHVHALPFDILKVDRTFVSACRQGDRRAVATIAAVGALAAQISVDVVAEGVEHRWELPALRALGCSYAQGYGLSRPLAPEVVATALAEQGPRGWFLEPLASRTAAIVG
jgi:diguanylate cyclase (GGDEF)-like protein